MKKTFIILLIGLFLFPINIFAEEKEETTDSKIEIVTLAKCVDGDTAHFKTSEEEDITARFLAVDTPESVHPTKGVEPYGKEASEYTCTTLTNAKEIRLEYDQNSDEEDRYGRKLVWVFVDDVLLQDLLVSQGYAEVAYLYGDYKYTPLLQDSEAVAKASKLGIWSIDDSDIIKEEVKEEKTTTAKDKKNEKKGFFDQLLDHLMDSIIDFFDDLLEKMLKMIEDML